MFSAFSTVWKVLVFGIFLFRILPHLDWFRDTPYLSIFSPNAENTDQKNSEYWHVLRSAEYYLFLLFIDLPVVSIRFNLGKTFSRNERLTHLTLSWRRPLSYRNQSIDLLNGLRHERVKLMTHFIGTDLCCESVDWLLFEWAVGVRWAVSLFRRMMC